MSQQRLPFSIDIHIQLRQAPEWSELSELDLQEVEKVGICTQYDVGDVIFDENEPCLGVYFVTSGLVGVRKAGLEGESTLLKLVYPNDTLGYRPLLANENHRATAEALKVSSACFINKETVLAMIRHNPSLGLKLLHRVARDLGYAEQCYHEKSTLPLRTRFAHLLLLWNDRCGNRSENGKFRLEIPVSRADLAAMLGVRRETVSRMIQKLKKEGITHFSERHVEVEDAHSLITELNNSQE